MIRHALVIIGIFISVFPQAQVSVRIKEDFSSNKLGWYEDDKVKVTGGHYVLTTPANGWFAPFVIKADPLKDFIFQASFTQIDGEVDNGFGLVWGSDKESKLNSFLISTNGYVKIYSSDEFRLEAKDWNETTLVKPLTQTNKLRIEQTKGVMKFSLNGEEVATMKALPWFGKTVGFIAYTQMKLYVDDFVFAHQDKINLPPTLAKGLVKENLGDKINSRYDEVTPKIAVDGKMILFTRKSSPDNVGGEKDLSDIWMSTSTDGVNWKQAVNLQKPVNSAAVNNIVSISQDNNSILVAQSNDFQVFQRTKDGWRDAGLLGVYYETENEFFEACQSADGKAILFTAENKQNLYYRKQESEKDIYVVLKDQKGAWSTPINLGNTLNTPGDETSPFLAADGRTLYFATNGRPGYGGQDMFMSKRMGDGWTKWSDPVNLGPELNTFSFDAYYTVPASGEYAYMVSSTGGKGLTDIIRVKLSKEIKPDPVVLVYGKVLNAKTNQPIEADIFFENLLTTKEAGEARSNPKTGEYRIALPFGATYGFRAVAKAFLSVNESMELNQSDKNYQEIEKNLYLAPIEIGQAVQLQNVFFIQGKAELKPSSFPELDRLVTLLKANATIEIEVHGHTDNRGDISANYDLSDKRAKAVIAYLISKGIDKNRLNGKGFGGTRPVVANDTDEHREMNRRVDFRIVKR
ncbi:MAG: flagellar motor protein MotB [Azospira oryzae]|jgi:outer membrane protein OmpA-like peptidoglycan-associated protein|nr:MAG: flagellar motor protein MotB [Azospira oryzae]